jgi:transposase
MSLDQKKVLQIVELLREGKVVKEISEELDVSRKSVIKYGKMYGVYTPNKMTDEEKRKILDLHRSGLTYKQISNRIGRSVSSINRVINNVALRLEESKRLYIMEARKQGKYIERKLKGFSFGWVIVVDPSWDWDTYDYRVGKKVNPISIPERRTEPKQESTPVPTLTSDIQNPLYRPLNNEEMCDLIGKVLINRQNPRIRGLVIGTEENKNNVNVLLSSTYELSAHELFEDWLTEDRKICGIVKK